MNTEIEKQLQDIKIIKPLKPGGQKDVYIVESAKYGKCILKLIRASKIERVIREDYEYNKIVKQSQRLDKYLNLKMRELVK